jgi:hypothetical protein
MTVAKATWTIEEVVQEWIDEIGGEVYGMTNPIFEDIKDRTCRSIAAINEIMGDPIDFETTANIAEILINEEFRKF